MKSYLYTKTEVHNHEPSYLRLNSVEDRNTRITKRKGNLSIRPVYIKDILILTENEERIKLFIEISFIEILK